MKRYLVIGNPIEHSLSPKLHNYWIKNNNIDAIYETRYERSTRGPSRVHSCAAGKGRLGTRVRFCAAHDKSEPAREDASHRRQSSATSEFGDVTEFRCPGPTPSDAASPVCPSRHHAAGYGQLPPGLQRVQQDFHPITMCTSHHHIITYYIARTD